jgi:hypothetical protein
VTGKTQNNDVCVTESGDCSTEPQGVFPPRNAQNKLVFKEFRLFGCDKESSGRNMSMFCAEPGA